MTQIKVKRAGNTSDDTDAQASAMSPPVQLGRPTCCRRTRLGWRTSRANRSIHGPCRASRSPTPTTHCLDSKHATSCRLLVSAGARAYRGHRNAPVPDNTSWFESGRLRARVGQALDREVSSRPSQASRPCGVLHRLHSSGPITGLDPRLEARGLGRIANEWRARSQRYRSGPRCSVIDDSSGAMNCALSSVARKAHEPDRDQIRPGCLPKSMTCRHRSGLWVKHLVCSYRSWLSVSLTRVGPLRRNARDKRVGSHVFEDPGAASSIGPPPVCAPGVLELASGEGA